MTVPPGLSNASRRMLKNGKRRSSSGFYVSRPPKNGEVSIRPQKTQATRPPFSTTCSDNSPADFYLAAIIPQLIFKSSNPIYIRLGERKKRWEVGGAFRGTRFGPPMYGLNEGSSGCDRFLNCREIILRIIVISCGRNFSGESAGSRSRKTNPGSPCLPLPDPSHNHP
jgi:hypothetical protein